MALGRATVLVSDSSVRLPATIARWVERRARERARAERPRDGSRDARERRGNGDGDGEIGGASRARGVGFVDAKKKKKKEEDEEAGLTFVLDCNRARGSTRSRSSSAMGRVCARCGWFERMISLREARRRFRRRIRRSPRDGSSRREADRAEASV